MPRLEVPKQRSPESATWLQSHWTSWQPKSHGFVWTNRCCECYLVCCCWQVKASSQPSSFPVSRVGLVSLHLRHGRRCSGSCWSLLIRAASSSYELPCSRCRVHHSAGMCHWIGYVDVMYRGLQLVLHLHLHWSHVVWECWRVSSSLREKMTVRSFGIVEARERVHSRGTYFRGSGRAGAAVEVLGRGMGPGRWAEGVLKLLSLATESQLLPSRPSFDGCQPGRRRPSRETRTASPAAAASWRPRGGCRPCRKRGGRCR